MSRHGVVNTDHILVQKGDPPVATGLRATTRMPGGSMVHNSLQNYAKSTALDEYVLRMSLDIQIGSLGAEKFNF